MTNPVPSPTNTSPDQIAHWLMSANLRQIGELQILLANQGIEIHLGTGQLVGEYSVQEPNDSPFSK